MTATRSANSPHIQTDSLPPPSSPNSLCTQPHVIVSNTSRSVTHHPHPHRNNFNPNPTISTSPPPFGHSEHSDILISPNGRSQIPFENGFALSQNQSSPDSVHAVTNIVLLLLQLISQQLMPALKSLGLSEKITPVLTTLNSLLATNTPPHPGSQ